MADLWTERNPGVTWMVAVFGVLAGVIVSLCATGRAGVVAIAVAVLCGCYVFYRLLSAGDVLTGLIGVTAFLALVATLAAVIGGGGRLISTRMEHLFTGVQVVAHVPGDCDFERGGGRRRGGVDILCPNATWTANGSAVTGTVEVDAVDTPDRPGTPFDVTAWAVGDRATTDSLRHKYPSWLAVPLRTPWWMIPAGLLMTLVLGLAPAVMTSKRRQRLARAHGWEHTPTAELPESLPLERETTSKVSDVLTGVRDGVPAMIFETVIGKDQKIVYAVEALPFDLPPAAIGPYRVGGRWVLRSGPVTVGNADLMAGVDEVRRFADELIEAARQERLDELVRRFEDAGSARKP